MLISRASHLCPCHRAHGADGRCCCTHGTRKWERRALACPRRSQTTLVPWWRRSVAGPAPSPSTGGLQMSPTRPQLELWARPEPATELDTAADRMAQDRADATTTALWQVVEAGFNPAETRRQMRDIVYDDNLDLIRESIQLVRELDRA